MTLMHQFNASSAYHERIISASSAHHQTKPGQRRLQSRGPNSRTCVLVYRSFAALYKETTPEDLARALKGKFVSCNVQYRDKNTDALVCNVFVQKPPEGF